MTDFGPIFKSQFQLTLFSSVLFCSAFGQIVRKLHGSIYYDAEGPDAAAQGGLAAKANTQALTKPVLPTLTLIKPIRTII